MAIFDSKVATQFRQEILSFEKSVMVNLTQLLKLLLKATSCAKSENQSNCIKRLSLRLFLIPCSCPTIAVIAKLLIKLKFEKIKKIKNHCFHCEWHKIGQLALIKNTLFIFCLVQNYYYQNIFFHSLTLAPPLLSLWYFNC